MQVPETPTPAGPHSAQPPRTPAPRSSFFPTPPPDELTGLESPQPLIEADEAIVVSEAAQVTTVDFRVQFIALLHGKELHQKPELAGLESTA